MTDPSAFADMFGSGSLFHHEGLDIEGLVHESVTWSRENRLSLLPAAVVHVRISMCPVFSFSV